MLNILHNQVTQHHFCVLFAYNKSSTLIIGRRTESDWTANATGKSFKLSKMANIGRKSARNLRFDRKWLFFVRNILLC